MLFSSLEFIFLFLPITLLVFFQIGRQGYYQAAIAWLVAVSFCFYGWGNVAYIGLLFGSIVFNYLIGVILSRASSNTALLLNRRGLLIFGIIVNLGLLGYFKYANFFLETTNQLIGTSFNLSKILLPLGISFFTFNQIAYLVDICRQKNESSNFLNYCLFVACFPYLIAGPLVRQKEIIPQLESPASFRVNYENIAVGLTLFGLGLIKKVLFADAIAGYSNLVFDAVARGESLTFIEAWIGAIAYTLQLYFDFSGYTDMAMGVARLFGIKLPINFNSPYKSANIIEFWRRWHITLSNFLRDYLYIPLGGNRKGQIRQCINLIIVMLLGGLWHGSGWTFVVWGGLHGIYLVINHQWRSFRRSLGQDLGQSRWWSRGLACLVTFLAVVVGWVFFRADNIADAIALLKATIGANGVSLPLFLSTPFGFLQKWGIKFDNAIPVTALSLWDAIAWISFLLIVVWFAPNTQQIMENYRPTLEEYLVETSRVKDSNLWQKLQWQPSVIFGTILGLLLFICIKTLLSAPATEFVYFKF